jgi:hypothetical protein
MKLRSMRAGRWNGFSETGYRNPNASRLAPGRVLFMVAFRSDNGRCRDTPAKKQYPFDANAQFAPG